MNNFNFNLWDCIVILILAIGLWWGARLGFAAQMVETGTFLIGVILGCNFYPYLSGVIASVGFEPATGNYFSFIIISVGFWFLMSPLRYKMKSLVLKIPPSVDTVLGMALTTVMGIILIGFLMMTVMWSSFGSLHESVEGTSFSGSKLVQLWPKVYMDTRDLNATKLDFNDRGDIGIRAADENNSNKGTLKDNSGGIKSVKVPDQKPPPKK